MTDADIKRCCRCKQDKPVAEFSRMASAGDGLCPRCRSCDIERKRKLREPEKLAKLAIRNAPTRQCRVCRNVKPVDEFYGRKDGAFLRVCKKCQAARTNAYYYANKTYCLKRQREYYLKNPELARASRKRWQLKNAAEISKNKRKYYLSNRAHLLAYARKRDAELSSTQRAEKIRKRAAWHRAHKHLPSFRRKRYSEQQKRRARKRSLPADFSIEHMEQALAAFDHRCAACRVAIGLAIPVHWDHWVPINSPRCPGTVASNMVPLCENCNQTKHDWDAERWLTKYFGKQKALAILRKVESYLSSRKQQK